MGFRAGITWVVAYFDRCGCRVLRPGHETIDEKILVTIFFGLSTAIRRRKDTIEWAGEPGLLQPCCDAIGVLILGDSQMIDEQWISMRNTVYLYVYRIYSYRTDHDPVAVLVLGPS